MWTYARIRDLEAWAINGGSQACSSALDVQAAVAKWHELDDAREAVILGSLNGDRRSLTRATCACVREALVQTRDPRVPMAIEVAERWARGETDEVELEDARAVAEAASADSNAARGYAVDAGTSVAITAQAAIETCLTGGCTAALDAVHYAAFALAFPEDPEGQRLSAALAHLTPIVRAHATPPSAELIAFMQNRGRPHP